MKRIVLFASGSGSNVENIYNYFKTNKNVSIEAVLTNKKNALVLDRCHRLGLASICFNKVAFSETEVILKLLKSIDPDLIILAGFLWKVPENIIKAFPQKIINIHPALLPDYGGKGMYGNKVHEAVKKNKEEKTGISIHFVNEYYDKGALIKQIKTPISTEASIEEIANAVHLLEYEHYPKAIEELLFKGQ